MLALNYSSTTFQRDILNMLNLSMRFSMTVPVAENCFISSMQLKSLYEDPDRQMCCPFLRNTRACYDQNSLFSSLGVNQAKMLRFVLYFF